MFKAAKNFILLNLFLLIPFCWIVSGFLPDRLALNVKTASGFTVSILREKNGKLERLNGASCRGNADWQLVRINLPDGHQADDLLLKFDGGVGKYSIAAIVILRSQFWQKKLDDFRLDDCIGENTLNLANQSWHSSPKPERRIAMALAGMELGLLLLAIMSVFVKVERRLLREDILSALPPAILFSAFFCFYLPVQSYLPNRAMFNYGVGDVIASMLPIWACVFFWCETVLTIVRRSLDYILHVLLLAVVFYEYLETGILTIGAPPLDGNFAFFYDTTRRLIDVGVIAGIAGVCSILYRRLRHCLGWICGGMIVFLCAAMFDTHVDEPVCDDASARHGKCLRQQVLENAGYSSHRNVMVFVLDCISTQLAMDAVNAEPQIRDMFDGFVAYTNNVGMHAYTLIGAPSLITGQYYFDNGNSKILQEREFAQEIYGKESFAWPYVTNNLPVFLCSAADSPYGLTTRLDLDNSPSRHEQIAETSVMNQRVEGGLAWNLKEICAFRIVPFPVKNLAYAILSSKWGSLEAVDSESILYPRLAKLPVHEDWPVALHSYHTDGGHAPFMTDRYGNGLPSPQNNYKGALEKTIFAFRCLADLMASYRALGIYDDSLIIVTTDHGNEYSQTHPYRAFPMLWVKPTAGIGPIEGSSVPTSHGQIRELVLCALNQKLSRADCDKILRKTHRLYLRVGVGDEGRQGDEYWMIDESCGLKRLTGLNDFPKDARIWRLGGNVGD